MWNFVRAVGDEFSGKAKFIGKLELFEVSYLIDLLHRWMERWLPID
ncbi:hypothetical protein [Corynebacterium felinum]|nr:hypothetical protein [Corynebacterium felinum]